MEIRTLLIGILILFSCLLCNAQSITGKQWSYKAILAVSSDLQDTIVVYSVNGGTQRMQVGANSLTFESDGKYSSLINNSLTINGLWKINGSDFIMDNDTMMVVEITDQEIRLKGSYPYLSIDGTLKNGELLINYSAPPPPLPVTLTSFNARKTENNILLDWQTTSEINASRFDIQRSVDQKSFETIGVVNAKGTSNDLVNYAYSDFFSDNPNITQVYYRLKLIDTDGTSTLSRMVVVILDQGTLGTVCYPNPFKGKLTVNSTLKQSAILTDLTGRTIFRLQLLRGSNELSGSKLPTGLYLLRTENNETIKLIKE